MKEYLISFRWETFYRYLKETILEIESGYDGASSTVLHVKIEKIINFTISIKLLTIRLFQLEINGLIYFEENIERMIV